MMVDIAIAAISSFRVWENRDWEYEYWSTGCEELFGYTVQELMADKNLWLSRVFPEDRETIVMPLFEAFFAQRNATAEYRFNRKDGSVCWISSTYACQKIEGNSWTIAVVHQDISDTAAATLRDRQQAEAEARQTEAEFRAVFNLIGVGMAQVDMKTRRILRANAAFCGITGYSEAELLALTVDDLNHPDDRDLLDGDSYQSEKRYRRKDGSAIDVEVTVSAFMEASKQFNLVLIKDITEVKRLEASRQQAETVVQESHQQMLAIWESITDAYTMLDLEWRIVYANSTSMGMLCQLANLEPEEILGKSHWELFPWTVGQSIEREYRRAIAQQVPVHLEVLYEPTGNWFEIHAYPSPVGLGLYFRDISDRKQLEIALQSSEEKLRLALDLNTIGIWEWNIGTGVVFWNASHYIVLGYQPGEIEPSYQRWRDRVHPDDIEFAEQRIIQALETHTDYEAELRLVLDDGSIRWLHSKGRAIYDEQGQPLRMVGVEYDISDRKQAELMHQQQLEREQAIADISQDIRRSLDLNEVLSRTVERVRHLLNTDRVIIFRFRPDWQGDVVVESVGKEWISILSTTIFDPCFEEHYIEPYRQGQISSMSDIDAEDIEPCYVEMLKPFQVKANLVIPLLPGEQLWGLLIAHQCSSPRQWQNAEIELLQQLANQVSIAIQQSELYQKIREQAALIDIATDAIFVRDLDNRILFWNQGAERLYGFPAAAALGKTADELFDGESASQIAENLNIAIEKGFWQGELEQFTKSGKEVKIASRWTLMRDESGQPKSILVVNSDITEKKQLEKQFYRAQRLESIGTLASGIAHDLNNILTPILAVSHLLPMKFPNLDEQTRQLLEILESSANRGASLVKQVLSFSRGQEGKRVTLQVEHLLSEVVSIANRTFPKSIQISANIPRMELWTISADSTQIHQVLMNLLVNARDAMPNGGSLTISAENRYLDENYAAMNLEAGEGYYVMITISDTGSGIPPELLERIFDPFFTTKEVGKGTGLGLATVIGIVKNHGGFVKVYSEMGNGTQFQVYLPASEGILSQPIIEEELPIGNGELILIVDDEPTIRQIAKTSLEKYNYRTLFASDGIEALSLYGKHQKEISVVLIDMMMPNLDGLTTIRAMQVMNPQVKAIATSGLASNSQLALAVNVKKFLLKPYTLKDLLNALHEVISTTNSQLD
ncbi:MAG TPA: histidine kinase [Cyanobacteria bacterium UBA11372]|nr:histidine kinase [Cyanobacteria bacterium UBA11372]